MTEHKVPALLVEKLRLGELSPDEAARVAAALGSDDAVQGPTDDEVFADDPPDAFAREVRRKVAESDWRARRSRVPWAVGGLVATALAAVLVIGLPQGEGPGLPADDVRLKGDRVDLRVYRDGPDGAERLGDEDVAGAGDRVQLGLSAHGLRHGLLYSVDGRGSVTEHHRWSDEDPGERVLPFAYVLDDAPSFEAFVLVASDAPLPFDALLAAARARGASEAAPEIPGAHVERFVLRKVGR